VAAAEDMVRCDRPGSPGVGMRHANACSSHVRAASEAFVAGTSVAAFSAKTPFATRRC
jgi:hypothetical protein